VYRRSISIGGINVMAAAAALAMKQAAKYRHQRVKRTRMAASASACSNDMALKNRHGIIA